MECRAYPPTIRTCHSNTTLSSVNEEQQRAIRLTLGIAIIFIRSNFNIHQKLDVKYVEGPYIAALWSLVLRTPAHHTLSMHGTVQNVGLVGRLEIRVRTSEIPVRHSLSIHTAISSPPSKQSSVSIAFRQSFLWYLPPTLVVATMT